MGVFLLIFKIIYDIMNAKHSLYIYYNACAFMVYCSYIDLIKI